MIHKTALIGSNCKIINSQINEEVSIADYNLLAYSSIGRYTYTGEFSHITSSSIGSFCSLSWNVSIGPGVHDYNKITTHPFLAVKRFGLVDEPVYNQYSGQCNIDNDVWIGCNSVIMRGVSVGNGAIVGANSVVTKDVPPYAIVVGSPAKIIKYRFEPAIIEALLELEWWNLPVSIISENTQLFASNPNLDIIKQIKLLK